MTIVEFFDKDFIENIASSLLCNPDKVIFVGDDEDAMNSAKTRFREITAKRGLSVNFECAVIERKSLKSIVEALTKIINENPDCNFDVEGGEDLYLVAVGIIYQKFGDKIGLHRYNIEEDKLNDFDMDGNPRRIFKGQINVKENVKIYGGKVIFEEENLRDGTKKIEFTEDFHADVNAMWSICRKNAGAWNFLMKDVSNTATRTELEFVYPKEITDKDRVIFRDLSDKGLVKNLRITPNNVTFTCKNETVKSCVLKVGTLLEYYISCACEKMRDENGERYFGDVKTGVFIDWDGKKTGDDVENEIDVVCTRGMVPVFISCKSGFVDSDELYKLSSVADRFGGKYAKKILCVIDLDRHGTSADSIRARAKDMGIKVIEKLENMPLSELQNKLKI